MLACPIRGKAGGTRQLCRGRKSYRTACTFTDGTAADVAVVATRPPGKDDRRRRKWLRFVVVNLDGSAHAIFGRYRRRFGIESAYRSGREVRIKTTSRNPMTRFFFFGFALLLVIIWAVLRWFIARVPGRGPHRVDPKRFQFCRFIQLLRRPLNKCAVLPFLSLSFVHLQFRSTEAGKAYDDGQLSCVTAEQNSAASIVLDNLVKQGTKPIQHLS